VGQVETFREHRHNLYHIVVYTRSEGAFSCEGQTIEQVQEPWSAYPRSVARLRVHRRQSVYSEVTFSFETPEGRVLEVSFERLLQIFTGLSLTLRSWQAILSRRPITWTR